MRKRCRRSPRFPLWPLIRKRARWAWLWLRSYFSVGSVVPWAMADVGAVATQANVNVGYGQQALDLLRQGLTAPEVLKKIHGRRQI